MQKLDSNKNTILRSTIVVGFLTFLSRALGLVRDIIFARLFGALPIMDAFFVSFNIPNTLRRIFLEGFSKSFIPVLSSQKEKQDQESVKNLVAGISGTLGLILFVFTVTSIILAPVITLIFAPGFFNGQSSNMDNRYDLTVAMLRFTLPYLLFNSLSAFLGAILNVSKKFWANAFTPIILNIVLIIAAGWIAPSASNPGLVLAVSVFIAGFLQLLFMLPFAHSIGQLPKAKWDWKNARVRKVVKLIIPTIVGSSADKVNLLFNILIASFLTTGSISWIYYSNRLLELPVGVFGIALGTVVLPYLSSKSEVANKAQFNSIIQRSIRIVLIVSIPAATALFILSGSIIAAIFFGGNFTLYDLQMTQYSLMAYSFGLVGLSLVIILSTTYFAKQNTKSPVKYGIISMVTNVILSILFVGIFILTDKSYPHIGLPLAFSFSTLINAFLLFRGLIYEKQIKINRNEIIFFIKILIANLIMAIMLLFFNPELPIWLENSTVERVIYLLKLIPAAIIVYLFTLYCIGFRLKEISIKDNI